MTAEDLKTFCFENAKQLTAHPTEQNLLDWEKRVKTFLPTTDAEVLKAIGEITAIYYEWIALLNPLDTCKACVDEQVKLLLNHIKQ